MGMRHESGEFLDVDSYKNVQRWTKAVKERPAVKRGQGVNRVWGDEAKRLPERHSAADLDDLVPSHATRVLLDYAPSSGP